MSGGARTAFIRCLAGRADRAGGGRRTGNDERGEKVTTNCVVTAHAGMIFMDDRLCPWASISPSKDGNGAVGALARLAPGGSLKHLEQLRSAVAERVHQCDQFAVGNSALIEITRQLCERALDDGDSFMFTE